MCTEDGEPILPWIQGTEVKEETARKKRDLKSVGLEEEEASVELGGEWKKTINVLNLVN